MYRLFYNYKEYGDVLKVVFSGNRVSSKHEMDNLCVCYDKDNNIQRVEINKISEIMKIRTFGMIMFPPKELLFIINSIFKNAKIDKDLKSEDSGFCVGKVVEKNGKKLRIDLGNSQYVEVIDVLGKILKSKFVIILKNNTIIANGEEIKEARLAFYSDLDASLDKDYIEFESNRFEIGDDYFKEGAMN